MEEFKMNKWLKVLECIDKNGAIASIKNLETGKISCIDMDGLYKFNRVVKRTKVGEIIEFESTYTEFY